MTYITLWLDRQDDATGCWHAIKLPQPRIRIGPYTLRHWAESNDLAIEYIDNCHVRVNVDRSQFFQFVRDVYDQEDAGDIDLDNSGPWRQYCLEAEEF